MSEFWIFIAIAGAIITFANKEDKARKRKRCDDTNAPQTSSQSDLERQLREIFGENTTSHKQTTAKIAKPAAKKAPKPTHTNTQPSLTQDKPTAEQNNTKEGRNSNIPDILEDFTMEKAVIYSEILKPKFEEY